ncbi:hypothetical protein [Hydrogenophaga sp. 2FB]|uniref:hypothetical protein n=1 Tax=Hydrogenophaga sp. 2FB TaxID=2502187 RepID=UPI0010F6BE90|nr:hypothetical protein [Hydrogenophaga sp. 2FB]
MLVLCREPDRLDDGKNNRRTGRSLFAEGLAPQPSVDMRAVLQLVALDVRVRQGGIGQHTADHLNERLLNTLKAAYQLNTSRLQWLNVLDVQTSLERWVHVVRARKDSTPALDLRKLEQCMIEVRRTVVLAGAAWNQAGPAFTRLTRLLPVQLEDAAPHFEPIEFAEMERLARIGESTLSGGQTLSPFSKARERYQKAAAEVAMAVVKVEQTSNALRFAENAFRVGARDAHEFASALIEHNQQRRELMQKSARACVARYALYALAQLLPEQLGLR